MLKTSRDSIYAFEVKLAMQNVPQAVNPPPGFQKHFSPQSPLAIVTFGGKKLKLSSSCLTVPLAELHDYLKELV